MDFILTPIEARVLGSLIEKQITTPDYYPLTLNALTNACNQKSNREPVMELDEKTVVRGLDSLREKHLVWQVKTVGSRVSKYEHNMEKVFKLSPQEIAILCVLLLRGPQTLGELRTRAARMYDFKDLAETEETLQNLTERGEDDPFAVKLPRQVGRKESRYAHLFCGYPPNLNAGEENEEFPPEPARLEVIAENERIAALEQKVADLQAEVEELKHRFAEFSKQFE